MKFIDEDVLLDMLFQKHVHDNEDTEMLLYYDDVVSVINNIPTVAAIPIEWIDKMMFEGEQDDSKAAWRVMRRWKNK